MHRLPEVWKRKNVTFGEFKDELADYLGLVGEAEIAERAGVKPNTVRVWLRRHDDFPKPAAELAMGPVWYWEDVRPWVNKQMSKQAVVRVQWLRHDGEVDIEVMGYDDFQAAAADIDTDVYRGVALGIPTREDLDAWSQVKP